MTNETDHEIEPLEFPDHQKAEPAPVLVLTARPRGEAQEAARERAKRWEAGETVPEVINFEEPAQLRALLTERRLQLIEQLLAERPASIRDLAATLDRGVKEVNEDVHLLVDYGIVSLEQDGRAKVPFVPYERIRIEIELAGADSGTDVDASTPA
jgi:predicted transcriptional regulator